MIQFNYETLTKEDLLNANNQQVKLMLDGIDFYIFIHIKPNSERLLVHTNGAIDKNKAEPPVFLRKSWRDDFEAHCLFIDDRTIHESPLNLGWGLGTKERYYVEDYARISQKVSQLLNVDDDQVTYFGSSGGGFISMMLATYHQNSRAIVNNPQAYVHRYSRNHVTKAYQFVFGEMSFNEVNQTYAHRLSTTNLMKKRNHIPEILYIQNRLSHKDMEDHVMPFTQMLDKYNLDSSRINFLLYNDRKSGHNPLPKDKTVELVNLFMKRQLNIY
ncbi:glycosyl transferase [Staphylococcus delphini]|uniref:Glycosyl transferase n=1 Tax=Staphylococcus delphini TaxID=53344 RepID=A0A2A4GZ42_9STAP|nr:glycosyl transferase [Staphylococcus delphini]MBZ8175040.1 glycosyl transferase [Staphylococcus delphini]PCF56131.1 glycosyl transferase [Staphylococcus delphini]PCF62368.1 glycosyl transferase [Staphylococcus delphini]PCF74619.1 glycosyl transferase [Staphylococcus delphini]HEC2158354.1 glycosyl transferase [Staphylococcus delphini]